MSYASHGKTVEERREEEKDALRNITRTLQETEDTSVRTAIKLNEQTESLHRIQGTAEDIEQNAKAGDWLLHSIKHPWKALGKWWAKPPPLAAGDAARPATAPQLQVFHDGRPAPASQTPAKERDDLDVIGDMVGVLKERTKEIGRTIEYQNTVVDNINDITTRNQSKMDEQKREMRNIISGKK
jgi:hypothetical protein